MKEGIEPKEQRSEDMDWREGLEEIFDVIQREAADLKQAFTGMNKDKVREGLESFGSTVKKQLQEAVDRLKGE